MPGPGSGMAGLDRLALKQEYPARRMQNHLGKGDLAVRGEADLEGLVLAIGPAGDGLGAVDLRETGKGAHRLFLIVG
jgi:hypothetical protein